MGGATSDGGPLGGPGPVSEADAMAMALDLARRGVRGANPLVGAVILNSEGQVLSHGYHRGAGTPHAEADALAAAAAAGDRAAP